MAKVDTRTSKELKQDAGSKYDREKLRIDLVPVSAVEGLARVLTYGANKYADRNWEAGISWSRVFGATMRHMWAWYRGEDLDPESGLPHLAHAMCNVAFLLEFSETRKSFDDRPIRRGTVGSPRDLCARFDYADRPTQDKQVPAGVLEGTPGLLCKETAQSAETETNINGDPWAI